MKRLLAALALILCSSLASAQSFNPGFIAYSTSNPTTSTCSPGRFWQNMTTGHLWGCKINTTPTQWQDLTAVAVDEAVAGASVTFPLQATGIANCTNPPYSFVAQTTAGLCYDSGTIKVQNRDIGARGSIQTTINGADIFFLDASFNANQISVGDNSISIVTEAGTGLNIGNNGLVTVTGTALRTPNGSATTPGYAFTSATGDGLYYGGSNTLIFANAAAASMAISGTVTQRGSGGQFTWSSSTNPVGAGADTGLARAAAGVVKVTNGGAGDGTLRTGDGTSTIPAYSFTANTALGFYNVGSNFLGFTNASGAQMLFGSQTIRQAAAGQYSWSSNSNPVSAVEDTGLTRVAAAIVKITNGSTGDGSIRVAAGTVGDPSYSFDDDPDTGFWSNGTGNLVASASNVAQFQVNGSALRLKSTLLVNWSSGDPSTTGADTGLSRQAAAEVLVNDGGAGPGKLAYRMPVSAQTGTYTPNAITTGYLYTNNGDADGSAATLPDNPVSGVCFEFVATADQDIDIVPNTGETLRLGTSTCSNVGLDAQGDWVKVCAAVGGAGSQWMMAALQGTPVCTP